MKKIFLTMLLALVTFSFSAHAQRGPRPSRVLDGVNRVLSGVYVTGKQVERVIDDIDMTYRIQRDRFPVKRDDKANVKIENGRGNNLTGRIWWTNAKINARGNQAVLSYFDENGVTDEYVITLQNKGVHEFNIMTKNGPETINIIVVDRIMNLVYSDGQTESLLGNR